MALGGYAETTVGQSVDELEQLRYRHKAVMERRSEMRQDLIQRLRQEVAQAERECEDIAQQLNQLSRDSTGPSLPPGY